MFTSRHVMAAAVAVSLLAGCEIVTSETYKTEGKIPSGFTYFLPKNMMKIEASTIKASTENVAKAKSAIAKLKTAATEAATAADATKTAQ
ncbi:MAG: hypothetical protein O3A85_14580, partial [Proteobacteria bacterium]|nr:hypothetical protein [Pseudomonadota bacterium]